MTVPHSDETKAPVVGSGRAAGSDASHGSSAMAAFRRLDIPLTIILTVALLLRLAVCIGGALRPSAYIQNDSHGYLSLANDLGAFTSKSGPNYLLSLSRTPVYPVYLSVIHDITGSSVIAPMAVQVLVSVCTVYLTFRLGRTLFGRVAGLGAAAALAIDPVSIAFSAVVLTEALFTFFLVGSLVLLWRPNDPRRWTRGLAAGLLLGLGTLTRPVSIYLSVVLAVAYLVLERKHLRQSVTVAVAFMIGFGVLAGGWIVRNEVVGGGVTISTIESYNLYYYRALGVVEQTQNLSEAQAYEEMSNELKAKLPGHPSPTETSAAERSMATTIIREHPVPYAKEVVKGAIRIVAGPGLDETVYALTGHTTELPNVYAVPYLIAFYILVALGLWSALRARLLRNGVLPVLVILYLLVVASGLEAYFRFRTPMMPFLALFAGVGLATVLGHRSGRPRLGARARGPDPAAASGPDVRPPSGSPAASASSAPGPPRDMHLGVAQERREQAHVVPLPETRSSGESLPDL
jgi:Dolichyl-phosphate-mannose-protein mannosyltransferase